MTVTAPDEESLPDDDALSADEPVAAHRPATGLGTGLVERLAAGSRSLTILGACVAALLVAALVFSVIRMSSQSGTISRYRSAAAADDSAMAAAKQYGVYLSSYDYHNLSGPTAPWTLVDRDSTAAFRHDFDSTKANLAKLITDYKATASGRVLQAAVQSATSQRAVVLLFVNQTVTNSAEKPGTQTQPLRVVLGLRSEHGKWLIDSVTAS